MPDAQYWINHLGLEPHPEGGFYKEMYRSPESIPDAGLPDRYKGPRAFATSIYFLLAGMDRSRLHRLKSDEIWYYHDGSSMTIHMIDEKGEYSSQMIGKDVFQVVIRKGLWFGATLDDTSTYSLVSCAVVPGYDPADFEMGKKEDLIKLCPSATPLIEKLTGW